MMPDAVLNGIMPTVQRLLRDPYWRTIALLAVAVFLTYEPVWHAGFVWDDDDYVTENPVLRTAGGLWRIWFEPTSLPQYYPLVHTTFWVEYQLAGLNATVYHLVNVALHVANAALVLAVLRRLAVPGAAFAALLFAVHPVHVESVAWITERKNVLSGLFYLLALRAWLIARPIDGTPPTTGARGTGVAMVWFVAALLSKTIACSLPAALLLLIWWKRGAVTRADLRATLPLFVVGLALAAVTVWIEKFHVVAEGAAWDLTLVQRVLIAARALVFYVGELLWPAGLTFSYPRWDVAANDPFAWLFVGVVAAVLGALVALRHRIGRGPLVAVLFFAGTLVPALGFFDVFPMRYAFVADHFQYLASLGPLVLVAALATRLPPRLLGVGIVVVAGVLAVLTNLQCRSYHDLETLWTDTLAKNPRSGLAHVNLGRIRAQRGDEAEALAHFEEALAIDAGLWEAHAGRGALRFAAGDLDAAEADFRAVIELAPRQPFGHHQLGLVLAERGRFADALQELAVAEQIAPDEAVVHSALALTHARHGDNQAAFDHVTKALALAPNDSATLLNAADVMLALGNPRKAMEIGLAVLRAAPHHALARDRTVRAIVAFTQDAADSEVARLAADVAKSVPQDADALVAALGTSLESVGRESAARAVRDAVKH